MTTEEMILLWLSEKKPYVKESTLAQYRRTLRKVLIKECHLFDCEDFNEASCNKIINYITKQYTPKSLRNAIIILNQFFNFAFNQNIISVPIHLDVKILGAKSQKIQIMKASEQREFTRFLADNTDSSKLGILICLYTGLRLGEICSLQWKDIDFKNQSIRISKTVQRISDGSGSTYFLVSHPKTECSEREIPIPSFLFKFIKEMNKHSDETCYIATGTNNFLQPRTYQNRLKSYLKRCGLPCYHFHTLRHTFASRAIELGVDIKALSEILGHSSTKITLDLYVHPSMEHKKKELQKLSILFK